MFYCVIWYLCCLIDFLSRRYVHWCECGVNVSYYYFPLVSLFMSVSFLFYVFRCFFSGWIYVNKYDVFFILIIFFNFIMPFSVFVGFFLLKNLKIYFYDFNFFHYSWFTVVCQFLLCRKMTQSYIYTYIVFLTLSSIMFHHKWMDRVPNAIQ